MNRFCKSTQKILILLIVLLVLVTGCSDGQSQPSPAPDNIFEIFNNVKNHENSLESTPPAIDEGIEVIEESAPTISDEGPKSLDDAQEDITATNNPEVGGQLNVHYIDVGQGDCILVHTDSDTMLIDAGNSGNGSSIVSYLKDSGISHINYLILTHPHADHIGGAAEVINAFDIDKVIMSKVSHTSQAFENLLLTIQEKGLKITSPALGTDYELGNASFKILAPNSDSYNGLNNYSVVAKLVFGQTSFLFAGDAESISESQMISSGYDLNADVLKVGHHGSDYSTSEIFLNAVSPRYSVISVGEGNLYGHPAQDTLDKLTASNVEIFRTDESGTIVAISDGNTITFSKKASPVKPNAPPIVSTPEPTIEPTPEVKPEPTENTQNITVYITETGSKYHNDGCQYLAKSKIPISLNDAKGKYGPCSKCNPPQ